MTPTPDHLWSTDECAAYLGCEPKTLENWRSSGKGGLPFIRLGRLIRYYPPAVVAWIETRLVTGTSEASPDHDGGTDQ
jgi:excisionase family DNA binding protein